MRPILASAILLLAVLCGISCAAEPLPTRQRSAQDVIYPEIPATKIKFAAVPSISFVSSTGLFSYVYSVTSSSSSEQNIWLFDVEIDTVFVSVRDIVNPSDGWEGSVAPRGAINWVQIYDGLIRPGQSVMGFGFKSQNLPGISRCFVQGLVPLGGTSGWVDENTPAPIEFEKNVVYQTTIGPSSFTFTEASSAINRLIILKHEGAALGWLGGPKLVDKLDQRLDQAAAALASGQNCIAHVRLAQFARRLSNAHDHPSQAAGNTRFASVEAAQLLRINAEVILGRVPKTSRSLEEERDCRKVEKDPDEVYD